MFRLTGAALLVLGLVFAIRADEPAAVLKSEFVFETEPQPECHASTIESTKQGLVVSWFAGKKEGADDVGIWLSRQTPAGWTAPVEVADGVDPSGKRYPCWNPVLFNYGDELVLFYKVGPSPRTWWGLLKRSTDAGETWSHAEKLPDGVLGPIKNKPVLLEDGKLVCPTSTEHEGWRVHFEFTKDRGKTWTATAPINDGQEFGAIQPSILIHKNGHLQMVCRSRQKFVLTATSQDHGQTWSPVSKTLVPNPNSGIDAMTLKDGRHLIVYNNTPKGRTPLNVAISTNSETWTDVVTLETAPGEYSYPAVIQSADGTVHITYTWKRERIKHVALDPAKL